MEFQLFCFLFEKNKSISKVKAHLQAVWSECCFPLKYCWVFVYCQTSAHPPKLEFSFLGNSKNSLNIGCFNRNKQHQVIVQLQDGVQNTTIVSYNNVRSFSSVFPHFDIYYSAITVSDFTIHICHLPGNPIVDVTYLKRRNILLFPWLIDHYYPKSD